MVYGQSRSRSVGWLCGSLIVDYIMGVEYLCTQGVLYTEWDASWITRGESIIQLTEGSCIIVCVDMKRYTF